MSDAPQTTALPPGFYWVQHEPYEGQAQRPLVAELSDMGNWYICGVEGREDPAIFKVLSGPLPPPENSGPQTTVTVPRWALQFLMDHCCFMDEGPREGWSSPEMDDARKALGKALEEQND